MKMTTKEIEKDKKDSLTELEELLDNDVISVDDDEDRLIPKPELQRIIMRVSIFAVLAIILFFAKMIDDITILLVALLIFLVIEGVNAKKIIKTKKNKVQFKPKE